MSLHIQTIRNNDWKEKLVKWIIAWEKELALFACLLIMVSLMLGNGRPHSSSSTSAGRVDTLPKKEYWISFPINEVLGRPSKFDSLNLILQFVGTSMSVD